MPRRCPPGVICFENVTIGIIVALTLASLGYIFMSSKQSSPPKQRPIFSSDGTMSFLDGNMSFLDGNLHLPRQPDVLFDAYEPPLRDDRYRSGSIPTMRGSIPTMRGSIPINIKTQGIDAEYRQVGILTKGVGGESILPLMGKPLLANRDKWNFYTMNDKNNMIKLPIRVKGKSGTSEYGCDDVTTGDTVFVEGYKEAFKVTAYDNDVIRYLA